MSIKVEIRRQAEGWIEFIGLIEANGEQKTYGDVYRTSEPIGDALSKFEAYMKMVEHRLNTPDWFERGGWLNVEQGVSHEPS